MRRRAIPLAFSLLMSGLVVLAVWYLHGRSLGILSPAGSVARDERQLMLYVLVLGLLIIVPLFTMLAIIGWKYREHNTSAVYQPEWDHSRLAESLWWGIPTVMIGILAVITWHATHALDPSRPLVSATPTMKIQVVAMDWKWLFIYPKEHIATVNFVQIPEGVPVDFEITSDAPMNSFWIPQLGGQIYAMSGMMTHLNLVADKTGDFRGSSANISGREFASMSFTARSTSASDYDSWVKEVQAASRQLDTSSYVALAQPSEHDPVTYYSTVDGDIYNQIVMSYAPSAMAGMTP